MPIWVTVAVNICDLTVALIEYPHFQPFILLMYIWIIAIDSTFDLKLQHCHTVVMPKDSMHRSQLAYAYILSQTTLSNMLPVQCKIHL